MVLFCCLAHHRFVASVRRLLIDTGGSVLVLLAVGLPVMLFATGFGIDFSRAENAQTQLNAIADAASLAAVDPSMIYQSNATAQTAAYAMFDAQAANVQGVTNIQRTATASTSPGIGGARVITVSYTAQSTNLFSTILGLNSLPISGTSGSTASQPPNINFYVVVDNSPSMLIPATDTGITELQGISSTDHGGCAFSCHNRLPLSSYAYQIVKKVNGTTYHVWVPDSPYTVNSPAETLTYFLVDTTDKVYDPSGNLLTGLHVCVDSGTETTLTNTDTIVSTAMDTLNNNCASGTISGQWADGYWAVENYSVLYPGSSNITLRIDDASSAVQQLAPYAYTTSLTNHATYGVQAFFYNNKMNDPGNLYPALPSGVSYISGTPVAQMTPMTVLTSATSLTVPPITVPRWIAAGCVTTNTCPSVSSGGTSNHTDMFNAMSALMPDPGTGSSNSTPQEVLFLITDGYDDVYGGGNTTDYSEDRGPLTTAQLAQCTAIKKRGIKIAVIYTQYLASSITQYPEYSKFLSPTDQVAAALQSCASSENGTPLYYQVSQNQSIIPALQQLFASVVQSAHLTQ